MPIAAMSFTLSNAGSGKGVTMILSEFVVIVLSICSLRKGYFELYNNVIAYMANNCLLTVRNTLDYCNVAWFTLN